MRKILLASFLFLISIATVSNASVETIISWTKLIFEAGRYRVEVATDKNHRVSVLKVWISGKLVKIPKEDFQRIVGPELEKVTISGSDCLDIPVLVATPDMPYGPLQDGGSWVMCFTGTKYTGMQAPSIQ